MRGLKLLPLVAVALFSVSAGAGASSAPPSTNSSDDGSVSSVAGGGVADAAPSIDAGAAVVDPLATPGRGDPLQVGPSLPARPVLPPGATGDQSITDSLDVPADSGEGRRIVYSNSLMRIWAIDEAGNLVKTHRVSGKTGVPYPGTYSVYSRSISTFATHNPTITWRYMVRFSHTPRGGQVGFHEIPTQCVGGSCNRMQTEEQLGQALSGGCVRQATEDAIWVWNWAGVGTKVVVLP